MCVGDWRGGGGGEGDTGTGGGGDSESIGGDGIDGLRGISASITFTTQKQ